MKYEINHVETLAQLQATYTFYREQFKGLCDIDNPVYALEQWVDRLRDHGELMVYTTHKQQVIGMAFGRVVDEARAIIGPVAVAESYRAKGIAREMMLRLETQATKYNLSVLQLGALSSANGFYSKLGYAGYLLVQSELHSTEELSAYDCGYEIISASVYQKTVSQLLIKLAEPDEQLEQAYRQSFPGCYTMMMYKKEIKQEHSQ